MEAVSDLEGKVETWHLAAEKRLSEERAKRDADQARLENQLGALVWLDDLLFFHTGVEAGKADQVVIRRIMEEHFGKGCLHPDTGVQRDQSLS